MCFSLSVRGSSFGLNFTGESVMPKESLWIIWTTTVYLRSGGQRRDTTMCGCRKDLLRTHSQLSKVSRNRKMHSILWLRLLSLLLEVTHYTCHPYNAHDTHPHQFDNMKAKKVLVSFPLCNSKGNGFGLLFAKLCHLQHIASDFHTCTSSQSVDPFIAILQWLWWENIN